MWISPTSEINKQKQKEKQQKKQRGENESINITLPCESPRHELTSKNQHKTLQPVHREGRTSVKLKNYPVNLPDMKLKINPKNKKQKIKKQMRGEPPHILSVLPYEPKMSLITLQLRPYYEMWSKSEKVRNHKNDQNMKKVKKWKHKKC